MWSLVVDPRHNPGVTGDVYVGTDNGVFLLPSGSKVWSRFGAGMPDVEVRDLKLDQSSNTLTAATMGRSVYQLFLTSVPPADAAIVPGTPPPPVYGAIHAVSGSGIWTGPLTLTGDTVISASGSQALQNGVATAQLNIVGVIQDPVGATTFAKLTKIGQGNVTLSGSNTYAGVTEINQGILIAQNPSALGAAGPTSDTLVDAGTALDLASDLALETVHLQGDGILFNNHNTGALDNISNNNTFTGTLVLDSNTTIGVNSTSTLTIGTKTNLAGTGTIIDGTAPNFSLTKELTGTLVLSSANTYTGTTLVNQGVLQVQNSQALGGIANGTSVLDGAQLQLLMPTTGPNAGQPVAVTGEDLFLSGTGIANTGAFLDSGGNNSWNYNGTSGSVTLDSVPVLLIPSNTPATTPPGDIAIGVANAADTLTVNAPIGQAVNTFGLQKVGAGRLTLTSVDTYTGSSKDTFDTTVVAGALRIQNSAALGGTALGTQVQNGAALEIDGDPMGTHASMTIAGENLNLNGAGIIDPVTHLGTGALRNVSGNNTWQVIPNTVFGNVTLQGNTLIGVDPGTQLTVAAPIGDPSPLPVPAASLTKVGTGTLVFPIANSYAGKTIVSAGVLNMQNAASLGGAAEQQLINVTGPNGTFTINFNGASTTPININSPTLLADITNALNALPTIGGPPAGGFVTVTQGSTPNTNLYVVTFGGNLAGYNVPLMTIPTLTGGANVLTSTLSDGPEGTIVQSGATLQVQGGITVPSEFLTLVRHRFQWRRRFGKRLGQQHLANIANRCLELHGGFRLRRAGVQQCPSSQPESNVGVHCHHHGRGGSRLSEQNSGLARQRQCHRHQWRSVRHRLRQRHKRGAAHGGIGTGAI